MRKKMLLLGVLLLLFSGYGCSVVMAVKQPEEKNLDVLSVGSHQDVVRAELGAPISTGVIVEGNEKYDYDVFGFSEGNSRGWGVARGVLYGVLDFFTLGFWEIFGTPIEGAISGGEKRNIRVIYSKEKAVMRVDDLRPPLRQ